MDIGRDRIGRSGRKFEEGYDSVQHGRRQHALGVGTQVQLPRNEEAVRVSLSRMGQRAHAHTCQWIAACVASASAVRLTPCSFAPRTRWS